MSGKIIGPCFEHENRRRLEYTEQVMYLSLALEGIEFLHTSFVRFYCAISG